MQGETAFVVPAYQCRRSIGSVVGDIREHFPHALIIVVDDGSDDGTADAAREAGVIVLCHATNRGKGAALRTGFRHALGAGTQVVVTLDGDGQHLASDAVALVDAVLKDGADLAVGNRMLDPAGMPWDRRVSNSLSSLIVSVAIQRRVPDVQCGLRAVKASLLRRLPLRADYFEVETEMLLVAAMAGARIVSIPIRSVYAKDGQGASHIRRVRDTIRFLALLGRTAFRWA